MATTDPTGQAGRRQPPRFALSGREWKLYLVAALALAYSGAFVGVTRQAATAGAPCVDGGAQAASTAAAPPRATRPAAPAQASSAAVARIRTRSS